MSRPDQTSTDDSGGAADKGVAERGMKIGLREQADEAAREMQMRYRVYSVRVKKGSMTEAEKAIGIGVMRAIRDTLRLFAEHEDAVREALRAAMAAHRAADPARSDAVGAQQESAADPGRRPAVGAQQESEADPDEALRGGASAKSAGLAPPNIADHPIVKALTDQGATLAGVEPMFPRAASEHEAGPPSADGDDTTTEQGELTL